jgi:chemotaxis signal transduction protein
VAETAELACAILPSAAQQLVVPAVCIAEVLPWRGVDRLADEPAWIAGCLTWHGQSIKVLDLDALASGAAATDRGRCVVVMNRTSAGGTPFYGLITTGIPRLVQLAQADIVAEEAAASPLMRVSMRVGAERLTIPHLGQIESLMAGSSAPARPPAGA